MYFTMEKTKISLPPTINHQVRFPSGSELLVCTRPFVLRLHINGQLSKRLRRNILQSIYREIKPMLWYIGTEWLQHDNDSELSFMRNSRRGISFRQTTSPHGVRNGNFGHMLRIRRLELGLTQSQLAEAIGIDRTHLSRIEHGKSSPRLVTFKRLESMLRGTLYDHFEAELVSRRLRRMNASRQVRSADTVKLNGTALERRQYISSLAPNNFLPRINS